MRHRHLLLVLALTPACGGQGGGDVTTSTAALTPVAFTIAPEGRAIAEVTPLRLAASGAPGDGFTYTWDFGDGTTGAGLEAAKVYRAPGNYPVALTVTDARGASAVSTRTVEVLRLNGYWLDREAGLGNYAIEIEQQGSVLTGRIDTFRRGCRGAAIRGTIEGRTVTYAGEDECHHFDSFEGTLDPTLSTITGELWFRESDGHARRFQMTLRR